MDAQKFGIGKCQRCNVEYIYPKIKCILPKGSEAMCKGNVTNMCLDCLKKIQPGEYVTPCQFRETVTWQNTQTIFSQDFNGPMKPQGHVRIMVSLIHNPSNMRGHKGVTHVTFIV